MILGPRFPADVAVPATRRSLNPALTTDPCDLDAPLRAMHQGHGSQGQLHGVCGLWQGARSWAPSGDLWGLLLAQGGLLW
jgi:hypothetical protein